MDAESGVEPMLTRRPANPESSLLWWGETSGICPNVNLLLFVAFPLRGSYSVMIDRLCTVYLPHILL